MSFQPKDEKQAVLNQLWGRFVPPLTSEQVELSLQVWQKIKDRKQREQKSELTARSK